MALPRAGEARVILVALVTRRALGIINLCGLELIVIQNSNLMTTFFNLYFDTPKAAGKKRVPENIH